MELSRRTATFTESVIREMTRLAMRHNAINLAQGFPDFSAPQALKDAAVAAIQANVNQYAITWGAKSLRDALARKFETYNGVTVDPEVNVTVCCGSTEAMVSALLAVTNPGDEVIISEPFYENYGPDAVLCDALPRYIRHTPPDWSFDRDELRALFNKKTKAIILTTPHNPMGKVYTREELQFVAKLCQEHDCITITDEIYEHILYDGAKHLSMASLPGMQSRTITIGGISKTYALTGWRVGWCIAPQQISDSIRKVHDFLTVGAAAPLQEGAVAGLQMAPEYYERMAQDYAQRRELLWKSLKDAGFGLYQKPQGAYYIMTDISGFGFSDDVAFAKHLIEHIGVAVVPGSSFYADPALGRQQVRFAFCKKLSTLEEAAKRLRQL